MHLMWDCVALLLISYDLAMIPIEVAWDLPREDKALGQSVLRHLESCGLRMCQGTPIWFVALEIAYWTLSALAAEVLHGSCASHINVGIQG
eukprot:3389695-Amphidinium_carterae.1